MPKDENPAEAPAETPIVEAAPEAPAENVPAEEAAPEAPAENTPAEPETPAENKPAEEAPEAPAENTPAEPETPAENKPAEEAAPAENTPVVEATPTPAAPATPKKKHTGLIAGIAAAVVVVGGGAGFALYKNNPDVVAVEAITSLINAKQLSYTMETEMLPADSDSVSGIKSMKMTFAGLYDNNGEIKSEATATLSVDVEDSDEPIKVTVGSAVVKDYTIYVKLDDLKESFEVVKDFLEENGTDLGELEDFIEDTIKKIDGVWWKISIDDILDITGTKGQDAKLVKGIYNCITDTIERESSKSSTYADLYKEHKFINLEKYDGSKDYSKKLGAGTIYTAKFDGGELAEYLNGTLKSIDTDSIKTCLDEAGLSNAESIDFSRLKEDPIDKETVKSALKDAPKFYVSINGFFAHTLTGIYVPNVADESSATFTGDITMKFTQGKGDFKSTLDTGSAKSISDLKETIEEIVEEAQSLNLRNRRPSYLDDDYDYDFDDDDDDYDYDYDLDDLYDDEELDDLLKSLED